MGRPEPRESKSRNDHVFVIRRIVAMVVIVLTLAASLVSTIASGRAVEAARVMQQSQINQPRNSTNGNTASNDRDASNTDNSSSNSESTTNSQSNSSSDSKKTSDNNSSETNTDPKAADIEKTLAADKTAQPLTDAQKSAIFNRAKQTAQTATAASGTGPITYTYCLQTKGNVGNATAFANAVYATLNDPQGWPRAGVVFEQSTEETCASADMAIILSEAQYLPTFSSYCSVQYSCRVGQEVIVNNDRWNGAVDAWLDAGGTLSRYRQMVINHEVGHRLGHIDNETTCAGAGQRAPLMQEQSMHLDGCVPNEWPLDNELWIG